LIRNKKTKGKIYTIFSLSLFISISIPIVSKASVGINSYSDKNLIYTQIFNRGFPIAKTINFDEDDMAEFDYSLKTKLLDVVGLNISNPLSIVSREFNLIKNGDPEAAVRENKSSFILNPFKLDENNIIKNPETTPSNKPVDYTKVSEVYNPKLKKTLNPSNPEVLIYHSHTTESYLPNPPNITDPTKNVCAVGDVIAAELEKNYGIATIHDKTIHNMVFNNSYARSGETVDKYLSKYKNFKVIIDLHRDAIAAGDDIKVSMHNQSTARFMFVVGMKNPTYGKNLALARKLSSITQSLFPGLIRPGNSGDYGIYHYEKGKFNQQKNPAIILMEIGSNNNTLEEAKTTGVYIARILAEYINEKQ